jgi:hypothetical protein
MRLAFVYICIERKKTSICVRKREIGMFSLSLSLSLSLSFPFFITIMLIAVSVRKEKEILNELTLTMK